MSASLPPALSILDLVRVTQEGGPRAALDRARDLAAHAERFGFQRYWVAEHHNFRGIASAATAVVIGHIAAGTSSIRVGAGGIMLPNHAPIVIAEQFGTLAQLFPGRIDLGLGRAPGTDQRTMAALRRTLTNSDNFPHDVLELQSYLAADADSRPVVAVPAQGTQVPLWILGSSTYGAQLAAYLGLPYGFASHFAPAQLLEALHLYRSQFQPSAQLARPYALVGVNIIAADSDEEARRLRTTQQISAVNMLRGEFGFSHPPIDDMESYWTQQERYQVQIKLACSIIGSRDTVRRGIAELVADTAADELMIVSDVYDHQARLRSIELIAEAAASLGAEGQAAVAD